MIKKKQFIEMLNNALDTEEEVAQHFYKYAVTSLKYYKWLDEEKRDKLSEITTKLSSDCQRHKSMIENLIQHVQESDKNVF
jgi:rubrerythrin